MIVYDEKQALFRTPGGRDVLFTYRVGTNDWNTLWSSLNEDEYKLPSGLSGWAFDIGGYLGSVSIALLVDNPALRVICVEPVPDNCRLIRWAAEANNVADRLTLIEGAAGGPGDDEVTVWYGYRGNEAAEHHAFVGNSSLAYDASGALDHDEATYKAVTLHGLVEQRSAMAWAGTPFARVSYMKIDCEGGEFSILADPMVSQIDTIVGEWHPVRGHTQSDFAALLAATHVVTFSGPLEGPGGFVATRR